MGQLGVGVMIGELSGKAESVDAFQAGINKKITALSLSDDALHFTFEDGTKLRLADEGQSCCESRYMRTDDDLQYHIGATLLNAEVRDADTGNDEHEVQFLVVTTSKGVFTMANHNEHNGYYGGFLIRASLES